MMTFTVKQKASGCKVEGASGVYRRMKAIAESDQESFWILGLNNANKEIIRQCIALGCGNTCKVDVSIVMQRLLTAGCVSWVAVHNHPSDSLEPSDEDIKITETLCMASKIIGLKLHDHIIVSSDGYYSFYEHSLMERIEKESETQLNSRRYYGELNSEKKAKRPYISENFTLGWIRDLVKVKESPEVTVRKIKDAIRRVDEVNER